MFENILDPKEIRSTLTDAGHTAAGFAALAAKKAIEVRSDLAGRYGTQLADVRTNALDMVQRAETARTEFEQRFEPIVAKMTERLPEPAQKVIADLTETRKTFQAKAHDFVVKTISADLPRTPKSSAAAAAPTPKRTVKSSASTTARKTPAAKTPAAKTARAAKPVARATKPSAKAKPKVTAKPTARRARAAA